MAAYQGGQAIGSVLIVEDNATFRETLKEALLSLFPSLHLQEASEGARALEIIRDSCPQLVFMDIRLPGESGLDLTRKVKNLCPNTKIIILTAYDEPEYLAAAAEAGITTFAVKGTLSPDHIAALVYESHAF